MPNSSPWCACRAGAGRAPRTVGVAGRSNSRRAAKRPCGDLQTCDRSSRTYTRRRCCARPRIAPTSAVHNLRAMWPACGACWLKRTWRASACTPRATSGESSSVAAIYCQSSGEGSQCKAAGGGGSAWRRARRRGRQPPAAAQGLGHDERGRGGRAAPRAAHSAPSLPPCPSPCLPAAPARPFQREAG
jgi:hypothetical protein